MTGISAEAAHDFLATIHNTCCDKKVVAIIGLAKIQIEEHLAQSHPQMIESEMALPSKMARINAYRKRTNTSPTIAHAVVNCAWRATQKQERRN